MSDNPNIQKLDELIPILMEGNLNNHQKKALDEILQTDQQALKYYENYIDTHIALEWHFAGNSHDLPSGLESEIEKSPKPKSFPITVFLVTIAALLVVGFFIKAPNVTSSYQLTNSVSAVWDGHENYNIGDKLKISSGYGELKTDDGIKVIVEGPAELELISKKRIILNKGKLVAYAPHKNTGFKINTPKTEVLDLGTELGVSVQENGDTEVHVLEGQVETLTQGTKSLLNHSEAKVITSKTNLLSKADAGRFMRVLPEKNQQTVSYIHWSFDEGNGQGSAYQGKNLPEKDYNAYFHSTYENGPLPKWIEGQFGKAVNFDATGGYLKTDYPGIGGAHARTVSFWVKVPKDAIERNAVSMLAWRSYKGKGKTWQITWNWKKNDGKVGALRAGLFYGQIVGTKDLRDDKWHHIAVVMFGGKRPNVNTHILLYVDGHLEPASRKSILDVQTDIDSKKSIKVLMGRNAMSYIQHKDKQNVFNGSMDEVYIFDCALDESQIRSLMNYNKSGLEDF